MEPAGNSTSSSFEDLGKESEVKERDMNPDFVDILGNGQLTKKVSDKVFFHIKILMFLNLVFVENYRFLSKVKTILDQKDSIYVPLSSLEVWMMVQLLKTIWTILQFKLEMWKLFKVIN